MASEALVGSQVPDLTAVPLADIPADQDGLLIRVLGSDERRIGVAAFNSSI